MSIELKKAAQQALEALETERDLRHGYSYRGGVRIVSTADEAINALRTAIQQAESEPVAVAAPHIAMGFGRYEVGSGTYQGTPCIAFGKNGTGKVGEFVTMEPRQMSAEETVAVITFANVEGLDVLQEKVDEVRALHFPDNHPAPGVPEFSRIAKRKLDELQEQGFAITGYAIQRGPVRGFIDGFGFVGWWQGEPDPGVPGDVARDAERWRTFLATRPSNTHEGIIAAIDAASPAQKGGE